MSQVHLTQASTFTSQYLARVVSTDILNDPDLSSTYTSASSNMPEAIGIMFSVIYGSFYKEGKSPGDSIQKSNGDQQQYVGLMGQKQRYVDLSGLRTIITSAS